MLEKKIQLKRFFLSIKHEDLVYYVDTLVLEWFKRCAGNPVCPSHFQKPQTSPTRTYKFAGYQHITPNSWFGNFTYACMHKPPYFSCSRRRNNNNREPKNWRLSELPTDRESSQWDFLQAFSYNNKLQQPNSSSLRGNNTLLMLVVSALVLLLLHTTTTQFNNNRQPEKRRKNVVGVLSSSSCSAPNVLEGDDTGGNGDGCKSACFSPSLSPFPPHSNGSKRYYLLIKTEPRYCRCLYCHQHHTWKAYNTPRRSTRSMECSVLSKKHREQLFPVSFSRKMEMKVFGIWRTSKTSKLASNHGLAGSWWWRVVLYGPCPIAPCEAAFQPPRPKPCALYDLYLFG